MRQPTSAFSLKLLLYLSSILALSSCDTKKEDSQATDQEQESDQLEEDYRVKAKFIEFSLGDTESYVFEDEKGQTLIFKSIQDDKFEFARELPDSEANMDNQGWGSNKSLQGRWFELTYEIRDIQLYDGQELEEAKIVVKVSMEELKDPKFDVQSVTIISTELNDASSQIPKVVDNANAENPIVMRINEELLSRFDLKNYDERPEDFFWADVTSTHQIQENVLKVHFKGDYIAARLNEHEEILVFDLSSGELVETIYSNDIIENPVDYQVGIIMPSEEAMGPMVCCLYTPLGGFKLYDSEGQRNGMIIGVSEYEHSPIIGTRLIIGQIEDGNERDIDLSNYKEVAYEESALIFHERKNGMLRVLSTDEDWWIKESDLEKDGFVVYNWPRFLVDKGEEMMGFFVEDGTILPIMSEPDSESNIISEIEGDQFEIKPTGQMNGNWMKVEVTVYNAPPCEDRGAVDLHQGWMQLTTIEGELLVKYYSRGC